MKDDNSVVTSCDIQIEKNIIKLIKLKIKRIGEQYQIEKLNIDKFCTEIELTKFDKDTYYVEDIFSHIYSLLHEKIYNNNSVFSRNC